MDPKRMEELRQQMATRTPADTHLLEIIEEHVTTGNIALAIAIADLSKVSDERAAELCKILTEASDSISEEVGKIFDTIPGLPTKEEAKEIYMEHALRMWNKNGNSTLQ